jgi:hypothetical protein
MFSQKQIVNRIICVFVDVGWYLSSREVVTEFTGVKQ